MKEIHYDKDIGGNTINPTDIQDFDDSLIRYIENIDPTLGTEQDPFHKEFHAFQNEINRINIDTIDISDMANDSGFSINKINIDDDEEIEEVSNDYFVGFGLDIIPENHYVTMEKLQDKSTVVFKDDNEEYVYSDQILTIDDLK